MPSLNPFKHAKKFISARIRQASRGIIALVWALGLALLALHYIYPPGFEKLFELLTEKFSIGFVGISTLTLLLLIFEKQFALEEKLERAAVYVHESEIDAFDALSQIISTRAVGKVDLVQVSGQTAIAFLTNLIRHNPKVEIRLLLLHESVAD
jgi:hypothetical protein